MKQAIEIFCCTADADLPFLHKLMTQLALKQQAGIITLWDKSRIPAGTNADEEIRRHLASARIFLLLIGPDFLASDYCYHMVLKAALARHARREAITIPVIVRPANWQDVHVLSRLQVLPRDGQPISRHPDQDNALWEVAREIDEAIKLLGGNLPAQHPGMTRHGPAESISPLSQYTPGKPNGGSAPHISPGSRFPSGEKPLPGQKKQRIRAGILLALVAAVLLIAGTIATATSLIHANGSNKDPNTLSQGSPTTGSSGASLSAQGSPTAGQSSLAQAPLTSPQLPLVIPCVNCPYPQLTFTLTSVLIDKPGQAMRWTFSIKNTGPSSCNSVDFYPITLIDSLGTSYNGHGQVDQSFAINSGQALQETALFSIIPESNSTYTLKMVLFLSGCNPSLPGATSNYQTENVTFA